MCEGFANCPFNAECTRRHQVDAMDLAAACVVEGRAIALSPHEEGHAGAVFRIDGGKRYEQDGTTPDRPIP